MYVYKDTYTYIYVFRRFLLFLNFTGLDESFVSYLGGWVFVEIE